MCALLYNDGRARKRAKWGLHALNGALPEIESVRHTTQASSSSASGGFLFG